MQTTNPSTKALSAGVSYWWLLVAAATCAVAGWLTLSARGDSFEGVAMMTWMGWGLVATAGALAVAWLTVFCARQ